MEMKTGQQPEVVGEIKKTIERAEQERRRIRFKHNLIVFFEGNNVVLKSDEFTHGLTRHFGLSSAADTAEKQRILVRLGDEVDNEDVDTRERVMAVMTLIIDDCLQLDDPDIAILAAQKFCEWLKQEQEIIAGFEIIFKKIEEIINWLFQQKNWIEARHLLTTLKRIQTGKYPKGNSFKSIAGRTLGNLCTREKFQFLTEAFLAGDASMDDLQESLLALGEPVVTYLLRKMIDSYSKMERLKLVSLIAAFKQVAVPVLTECIQKNPPWAVQRNIICIIAEIAETDLYHLIRNCIQHEDQRVQYETINCMIKLGGPNLKLRLIEALREVDENLKLHVLRLLSELEERDEDVFKAISQLVQKRASFSARSGFQLLVALITALKAFPTRDTIDLLEDIRLEYNNVSTGEQVALLVDEAIMGIEPRLRRKQSSRKSNDVSFDSDPVAKQYAYSQIQKVEEQVRAKLGSGDSEGAGQIIYDHGLAAAKAKDFIVAEMLRDRLLEVNSMALNEVIALGEFIEQEKNTIITSHHIEIWSELYREMSTEEFTILYHAMTEEQYSKGDVLARAGETDVNLYFLNSGYVSLNCQAGGKDVFLKRMQPGNILGWEQFFSASVWTVTLVAQSEVQVQVLELEAYKTILHDYPAIAEKLQKYCYNHDRIPELLKMSGDDRREHPRYSVTLITNNTLVDPFGNKARRVFKGELIDVSLAGLAFSIRITNADNARLLLGRQIITVIGVKGEELPQCCGVIVGVRRQNVMSQEYSVHVKLAKKLAKSTLRQVRALAAQ